MKSFRNPKYLERYEDVVFDLEQPLDINPNDGFYQKREVMKIVADNTSSYNIMLFKTTFSILNPTNPPHNPCHFVPLQTPSIPYHFPPVINFKKKKRIKILLKSHISQE